MSGDQALKDRLLKLLALARRGIGGEKANAQTILNRLLETHGLTLADLEGDADTLVVALHYFPYGNSFEERLLNQTACMVMNTRKPQSYQRGKTKATGYYLTAPQALELGLRWPLYRAAWQAHQERAFRAFVQANNIFPDAPADANAPSVPSAEDREDVRQMLAMARAIAPVIVRTLGSGA